MHEDLCVCVCVRACVCRGCSNIHESIKIDTGKGVKKLWLNRLI